MKKVFGTLIILTVIGLFGFFFAAAKIVDSERNVLISHEDRSPSPEVLDLHEKLVIADWHADNLLWDRDLLVERNHGHVDLPRLLKGNFTLQVFDAVIKTPKGQNYHKNSGNTDALTLLTIANRWPVKTWTSLYERALFQSKKLESAAKRSEGQLKLIRSASDLKRLLEERQIHRDQVGGILAIEGLHALEGNIEYLDGLYNAGFRIMGLTHFFDNKIGGSSAGEEQGGLTPFGKQVIQQMNEKDIIIDLAHASSKLIDDVLELSTKPVVVSHTGVKGTHDSPRNLSDQQLRAIAEKGGMVGIGFWEGAIGSIRPKAIVQTIRYVADLIGIEHVCLGSDWDGATTVAIDAAHIWMLTEEMLNQGFTQNEIQRVMGMNQVEFLLNQLPSS